VSQRICALGAMCFDVCVNNCSTSSIVMAVAVCACARHPDAGAMIQHSRHSLACRRRRHASTPPAISVQRQALGHLHRVVRTPPTRPRRPLPGLITSIFAVGCIQIAADAADGTEGAGAAAVGAAGAAADGPQRISMSGGSTGGTVSRGAAALRRRRSGRQAAAAAACC